jgi:LmbE family N-acetylglucosaminyl deacetylase
LIDFPAQLAAGASIAEPVALVVAHPDDETIALGGRLQQLRDLRLIHMTDGAPRDLGDARRLGFAGWEGYAAARERELAEALEQLGAGGAHRIRYGLPDQQAVFALPEIVARLTNDLAGVAVVVTHALEYGHPDHDATAVAVALACRRTAASPACFEFPGYHLAGTEEIYGHFRPDPAALETVLDLDSAARDRKAAAFTCFRTQAEVLARFPLGPERLRPVPERDLAAPVPPGQALYDRWGWALDSRGWHRAVTAVLRQMERAGPAAP